MLPSSLLPRQNRSIALSCPIEANNVKHTYWIGDSACFSLFVVWVWLPFCVEFILCLASLSGISPSCCLAQWLLFHHRLFHCLGDPLGLLFFSAVLFAVPTGWSPFCPFLPNPKTDRGQHHLTAPAAPQLPPSIHQFLQGETTATFRCPRESRDSPTSPST